MELMVRFYGTREQAAKKWRKQVPPLSRRGDLGRWQQCRGRGTRNWSPLNLWLGI